jgi:hypothetical protein
VGQAPKRAQWSCDHITPDDWHRRRSLNFAHRCDFPTEAERNEIFE